MSSSQNMGFNAQVSIVYGESYQVFEEDVNKVLTDLTRTHNRIIDIRYQETDERLSALIIFEDIRKK